MALQQSKILVVDDSITVQKLVNVSLAGRVAEIILASDAQDALLKAKRMKPELVLLDSSLPQDSSEELCRRLRAELPGSKLLLLEEEPTLNLRNQTDGNLSKPFNGDSLWAAIERIFDLSPNERPSDEEEVTQVRGAKASSSKADGPFSSFSAAEEMAPGTDMSSRLAQIASEFMPAPGVSPQPLTESKEEIPAPLSSADLPASVDEAPVVPTAEEPTPSDEPEVNSTAPVESPEPTRTSLPSFSKEELVQIAREQIDSWVQMEMPKLAEKWIKAAIAERSRQG